MDSKEQAYRPGRRSVCKRNDMTFGEIKGSFGDALGKGIGEIGARLSSVASASASALNGGMEERVSFCTQCGQQLDASTRFCPRCGQKMAAGDDAQPFEPSAQAMPPIPAVTSETRRSLYEGAIHKCPSCGSPIAPTDAVCTQCGHQIVGRAASGAAQQFANQLMEIEQSRGVFDELASVMLGPNASNANRRIITLIKTFPIPNTIEEISEFMYLAVSNIDVKLSKKSLFGAAPTPAKRSAMRGSPKCSRFIRRRSAHFPMIPYSLRSNHCMKTRWLS